MYLQSPSAHPKPKSKSPSIEWNCNMALKKDLKTVLPIIGFGKFKLFYSLVVDLLT